MIFVFTDDPLVDLSANYEITVEGGATLTIVQRRLIVTAKSATKIYDGTAIFDASEFIISGELPEGHVFIHENIGGANAGLYSGLLRKDLKVFDAEGVDVTEHYELVFSGSSKFSVEIVKKAVNAKVSSTTKQYDGTVTFDGTEFISQDTPLLEGHKLVFTCNKSTIGTQYVYTDTAYFKVYDEMNNDVTGNYSISFSANRFKLQTIQREITIKPQTVSRPYNGKALYGSKNADVVSDIKLLEGHTLTVETTGSQTEIGEGVLTIISHKIVDAEGNDVTSNYAVSYETGKVIVSKIILRLATSSASSVYTGETFSARGVTPVIGSLMEGHTIYDAEAAYAEVVNVGSYSNSVNGIKIHDAEGNDVTTLYYNISYTYGVLTIIET